MNKYRQVVQEVDEIYKQIAELRKKQIEVAKGNGLEEVQDYVFKDTEGKEIRLMDLFGEQEELIVIHNMGKSCPYCTLWADGFSSSTPHIQDRCAFALTSPNDYETMRDFAKDRDWKFSYYSAFESSFTEDMGFSFVDENEKKRFWPGFTSFLKKDNKVYRVACDTFGPGDFFSPIWGMIDMLHHSEKEWHPKFNPN
jgi:predicted dithiol-disulfide oxidoreductase (DUF899 family)